jgi:hypothetical protein
MRNETTRVRLLIAVAAAALLVPFTALHAAPGPAGSGQAAGGAPLSNADVIRMQQAILFAIESRPVKFDLSPAGLAALRRAGVSETVLSAMEARQSQAQASGTGAGAPTAQGTSPGQPSQKPTPQQISAMVAEVQKSSPQLSPVMNNPAAGQADAALVSLLRQQKQIALAERGRATPPAGHPSSPNFARTSAPTPALAGSVTRSPSAGNSLANGAALVRPGNMVLACAAFNNPVIQTVSGQQGSKAVFSQNPEFNPFTVKGCNFGNVTGRAQLNYPNGGMLADLRIDSWTDNLITVEVNPSLVNVLDQNNVTLVLFPPNKPQAQQSGFRFYAMRREMRLASIPRTPNTAQVALTNDEADQRVNPYYSSPYRGLAYTIAMQTGVPPSQVSPNLDQGWTAGVDRVNAVRFTAGTDVFRFDGLKQGFVLAKFQIDERNVVVCHAGSLFYLGTALKGGLPFAGVSNLVSAASSKGVTNYSDGTWSASTDQNTLRVNWAEGHCHATDGNDSSDSSYALNVWVVGPALAPGTSPWQSGTH